MATQLAVARQDTSLLASVSEETGFSPTKIQLIKEWVARGASDDELALFLHTAYRVGLDPMARQIYFIKRWDNTLRKETGKPEFSIDGLRLIADRTGRYAPGRAPTYEERDGVLYSATAYVMKWVQGQWVEVSATAYYSEFVQTTREGKVTSMWQSKPRLMLGKCAEALALRRAFPAELSGLYTSEEIGEASARPAIHVLRHDPDPAPMMIESPVDAVTGEILEQSPQPARTEPTPPTASLIPANYNPTIPVGDLSTRTELDTRWLYLLNRAVDLGITQEQLGMPIIPGAVLPPSWTKEGVRKAVQKLSNLVEVAESWRADPGETDPDEGEMAQF